MSYGVKSFQILTPMVTHVTVQNWSKTIKNRLYGRPDLFLVRLRRHKTTTMTTTTRKQVTSSAPSAINDGGGELNLKNDPNCQVSTASLVPSTVTMMDKLNNVSRRRQRKDMTPPIAVPGVMPCSHLANASEPAFRRWHRCRFDHFKMTNGFGFQHEVSY